MLYSHLLEDMSNELFIYSIQFSMYEHNENKLYIFLLSRNILITVGRTFSLKVKLAYAKSLLLQHGASNKEKKLFGQYGVYLNRRKK